MRDDHKSKADLSRELKALRKRVAELEQANCKQGDDGLGKSEAQFREIFENTEVGVYRTTPDGRILMANPALVRMLGYSSFEELAQRNLEEEGYEPKYSRSAFKERIERDGRVVGLESAWIRRDGSTVFVIENSRAIRDEHGNTLYYEGTAENITDRKKAEDKIERAAKEWSKTFDATSDLVFVQDKDFRFVKVNKSVGDVLKVKPEDLIGKKCYEVLHKSDKPWPNCPLAKTLKNKRPHTEEVYDPNIGVPLLISTSPLFDENGELTGAVHIAKDITERKKAEEELRESEEKYRRLFEGTGTDNTVISIDGVYLMMNEKGAEQLGGKPEDFVGKSVYDTFPRDAADEYVKRFRDVAESGETKTYEDLVELPGGNRWFLTDMWPVKDPDGGITSVQLISHDITEHEKMDEALRQSEQRFRSLVEATSDWVWEVDQDGIYTYSSPKVKDVLGYEPGDVIGKTPFDLMPPDEAERVGAIFRDTMACRKPLEQLENVNLHKDGRVVVLETSGVPIFDAGGGLVGYRGIDRDITERKKAEEEIKKFKTIADKAGYGNAITDLEGNLIYVNESFAKMHGYSIDELRGKNLSIFHNEEQMRKINRLNEQLVQEGSSVAEEVWHKRRDNTVFITLMNATLIRDEKGKPLFLAATAIDITEHRKAQEVLETYRDQMVRAERLASLGTLSATLAHELTQPLTVIALSIEDSLTDLEAVSCPQTVTDGLRDSLSEVSNATSIVERFRNFARKSSEKTVVKVDLKVVAERIVKLLNKSARQAGIRLRLKGMDTLPGVYSSEKEVEQLFFALVQNAIQAGDGNEPRELIIDGAVKDEHIELRFSDNCGGIEPEDVDKVFDPFFTTKPAGEGTGLGLCIVQRVAERTGGRVRVENKPGEGSTFVVTLGINKDRIS